MDKLIMLPGPTPVPPAGLEALGRQVIGHRVKAFSGLLEKTTNNLKKVFMTENDVLIFPASGTGGLEISVVNCLSPGDKILSISNGIFAERFRKIAVTYGMKVIKLDFPRGKACDYGQIENCLLNNPDLKAVLFTHNETSTGVQNNVQKMGELLKKHRALLIVDAVSSLGGIPLNTDEWGVDIVVTSSQKALMTPPGLAILSVSKKAWKQIKNSKTPKYYWDLLSAKKYYDERRQNPYTPAVSLLFALDRSLEHILDEGLNKVFKRHKILTESFRTGMEELNFSPFTPWTIASYTVSAFKQPQNIDFNKFTEHLVNNYKLYFAGGQQNLKNEIFRVGHMGYTKSSDILEAIQRFGQARKDFDFACDIESALMKSEKIIKGGNI